MKKSFVPRLTIILMVVGIINALYFGVGGLKHGPSGWISYAFIHVACFVVILSPAVAQKGKDRHIYLTSTYAITIGYAVLEFVIGGAFIILDPENYKFALFSQLILTAIAIIILCVNLMADTATNEAMKRHRQELVYVKESASMLSAILSNVSDKVLYRQIERAYDLISASPARSDDVVSGLENQVMQNIDMLDGTVQKGDEKAAMEYAEKIYRLANERNRKLKSLSY